MGVEWLSPRLIALINGQGVPRASLERAESTTFIHHRENVHWMKNGGGFTVRVRSEITAEAASKERMYCAVSFLLVGI
jgi:hypothetical protein